MYFFYRKIKVHNQPSNYYTINETNMSQVCNRYRNDIGMNKGIRLKMEDTG